MTQNPYNELIFSESDIVNFVMQGRGLDEFNNMIVDSTVDTDAIQQLLDRPLPFVKEQPHSLSVSEWHQHNQSQWFMPEQYQHMDIAEHVLSLCKTDAELQRCGHELMLYQERDLFDLLRYLVYLVDVMRSNNIIWGVGRGSSVASYVLYKLGVHRIDSMYYDLDPAEFLR